MMGKRLKEIFGLILSNITLVSGSLNAETVYADTQAKIEIEKTEMPLKICVDEENKKTVLQIVAAWKKIYKNNGVELMVIPSGQQASEEKVQEIQNEITTGEGPDVFFAEGPNPTWSEQRAVVFEDPQKEMYQGTFLSLKPYMNTASYDIRLFSICIYNTGFTGKYRNIKKLAGISQTKRKSNSTDCRAKKWGSIF